MAGIVVVATRGEACPGEGGGGGSAQTVRVGGADLHAGGVSVYS